jgi:glucose-1-phosphatase
MINLSKYETVILDLGGVIIDIYPQRVINALHELNKSSISEDDILKKIKELQLVEKHEVGILTDQDFLLELSHLTQCNDLEALKYSWFQMLGDIPKVRIDVIERLKETHKVFLLSNTNSLHSDYIQNYLKKSHNTSFEQLFDKVYLSQHIGHRKPNVAIYEHILNESGIDVKTAVFVDDVFENAKSAEI